MTTLPSVPPAGRFLRKGALIGLAGLLACVSGKRTDLNTSTAATATTTAAPAPEAIPLPLPEENRFVREILVPGLREPMELTVTPDHNVFWIERKGWLQYYRAGTRKASRVKVPFDVFTGINDGLLGITLDPRYGENKFVYLFYSPAGETPKQHVSRFVFDENALELTGEKILLQIPTQREVCCHSAGSLAFGPDGNLYIGVGDNSSPRTEPAYVPVDEQPGRSAWDAQRTAGNTNDLRGKVLRIHPEPDGTYTIPTGNLFPKGTPDTRPEIYVMGARNPFRLSVDAKTGYLYFGDIGPDATKADWYGPEAYDEINLVKKAGNYGWPYFVGDNKAYPKYDFATKTAGTFNQPEAPVNTSPNNTGASILPPIQKPMIWYSYQASPEFPALGTGGRSAVAGPVYHYQPSDTRSNQFPEYYDNTLFIAEWMRDWIKAVRLDADGNYQSMEHFMPGSTFSSPMDMEFGPDGALYLLEYGKGWYSDNQDAKLVRISYVSGNRPPVAKAAASVRTGAVPLRVSFSSKGTGDLDGDALTCEWRLLNTDEVTSREPDPVFEFVQPGIYQTRLTVTDSQGNKAESVVEVIAGNTQPQIAVEVAGNTTFYWPAEKVKYQVKVQDHEDGAFPGGKIKPADLKIFLEYSAGGDNLSPLLTAQQHETAAQAEMLNHPGKVLMDQSDCRSCHAPDKNSIGPSYRDIARRYKDDPTAADRLAAKIINGGGGVWKREFVMVGHPSLSAKAASEMVRYIYTFAEEKPAPRQLQPGGTLTLAAPASGPADGSFLLMASYVDKGGPGVKPLEAKAVHTFRSPRIQAENYSGYGRFLKVIGKIEDGDSRYIGEVLKNGFVYYNDLDLTHIGSITLQYAGTKSGTTVEVRLGSDTGELIGSVAITPTGGKTNWQQGRIELKETRGRQNVFLVFRNEEKGGSLLSLDWIAFNKGKAVVPAGAKANTE